MTTTNPTVPTVHLPDGAIEIEDWQPDPDRGDY
jgi:hypothetical protein